MLLTLNAASLQYHLNDGTVGEDGSKLGLVDAPKFALEQLLLRGLVIDTSLLRGWNLDDLHNLRNRADQAACPCLILRESAAVNADSPDVDKSEVAMTRVGLVARAAQRLGCNALALHLEAFETDESLDRVVVFLRGIMERIDRMELNLLIEPGEGMLSKPDPLIQLIKKVGGFRIGTMPTFQNALASGDCAATLRQTAPYAGAILATCGLKSWEKRDTKTATTTKKTARSPKPKGLTKTELKHILACVDAIRNVGYSQILALDYIGTGDGSKAIEQTRELILEAMAAE